jgi:hypothetical protein
VNFFKFPNCQPKSHKGRKYIYKLFRAEQGQLVNGIRDIWKEDLGWERGREEKEEGKETK